MKTELYNLLNANDLPCTEDIAAKLALYYQLIDEGNKLTNLTALTDFNDFAVKHILDSLLPGKMISLAGMSVVDVGTGAGFPGLPLKICWPTLELFLMDSQLKRVNFLQHCCRQLGVEAEVIHSRAEDAGQGIYRNRFDRVFARAVAPLNVLAELCLPLTKLGGQFIALKGPRGSIEAVEAEVALDVLGGTIQAEESYELPGGERRTLIVILKKGHTPAIYPRRAGVPAKKPL